VQKNMNLLLNLKEGIIGRKREKIRFVILIEIF